MESVDGESMLVTHLVLESIQAEQEPHGKRGTSPQPGSGRQIGYVMDLDPTVDLQELQALARRRMLDPAIVIYVFNSRVRQAALILEKGREPSGRNVAALVDSGREHSAAVLAVPDGIIRASAEERNAKRSTSNDHISILPIVCSGRPSGSAARNFNL